MKQDQFESVQLPNNPVSRFDLSHDVKMSFKMGYLVPTTLMETMPGDNFNMSVENMLRFAPLISPVMHRIDVTTHWFFCPYRILWDNWDEWITGNLDVECPYINVSSVVQGSILNYLGFPVGTFPVAQKVHLLPLLAYIKIWNEYYMDQNLQNAIDLPVVAGDNTIVYFGILNSEPLRRAWQHDYFTACLPFAQKGDAVQIPLTFQQNIPVTANPANGPAVIRNLDGTTDSGFYVYQGTGPVPQIGSLTHPGNGKRQYLDPMGTLEVDIQSDATDINTLRRAFKLQEWLERNARGGTRYNETILAQFGVKSSDSRLQRPEYLGGAKQNMVISEVLATAQSVDVPVGQMAGHGISVGGGNQFRYYCEEHGVILGLINVQPQTAYMQGIHRMFTRLDRLDHAWPVFSNIGEQEVLLKELYAEATTPEQVFGYIPRYSEYRYMNNRVAGEMSTSLDFWHMARKFDAAPQLNTEFISCIPTERIFAVEEGGDNIYAHIFNNVYATRKLPKFGVPTI